MKVLTGTPDRVRGASQSDNVAAAAGRVQARRRDA